jgi:Fe-S cluster assembly protein SufD
MSSAVKNFVLHPAADNAAALPWLTGAEALAKDGAPEWARALRATGAEAFAATGMPTPDWEGWQYTNLRALSAEKFAWHKEPAKFDAGKLPVPLLADSYRAVLVNGQYQEKLSCLPKGVTLTPVLEAKGADDYLVAVGNLSERPLVALNSAYVRDGFVLKTEKGADIDQPIEVLFYTTDGSASYPRVVYWLAENSGVTILERHTGEGAYFANLYASVGLERDSRLKFYRFAEDSKAAVHYNCMQVQQQKGATFEGFSMATGGAVTRQETLLQLIDSGISTSMGGIYLMREQQNHDFTVTADHFEPNGTSVQHFKGVIDDQARTIFQGKIHVHRPAQKTDGYQSHHALLLSDRAEANAKPELEIYADDVKCTHGATAGYLDQKALFYMRSRGIPLDEARALLIESFLNENIERLTCEKVKTLYSIVIRRWLDMRKAA